jgi:hypothetical protein
LWIEPGSAACEVLRDYAQVSGGQRIEDRDTGQPRGFGFVDTHVSAALSRW